MIRPAIRIGQGVDIHPFAAYRPLFLGGVRISDTGGLAGHSDADAVLHAITDALLGAAGVTLVSVLGGIGLLPVANAQPDSPSARLASAAKPDASPDATNRRDGDPVEVDGAKFGKAAEESQRVARTARRSLAELEAADPVAHDIMLEVLEGLEKYRWMLVAHKG